MTRTVRDRRRTATVSAAALLALLGGAITATPAPAAPVPTAPIPCPSAYPLSSVTAGTVGTGFTVVTGTEPQPFDVEVLGILRNGVAPGKDMIVIKVSDQAGSDVISANGGSIWSGMSGSPVYVDGQLLGSVSFGFSGASPIGGLTPAADLYDVLAKTASATGSPKAATKIAVSAAQRRQWAQRSGAAIPQGSLEQLRTPLAVGGLSKAKIAGLQKAADKIGWNVAVYRAGRAAAATGAPTATPQAAGNFAGVISYGDITLGAVGTTTAVCGSQAVAFGHPLDFAGPVHYGASDASSFGIVADPVFGGFKLATITGSFGTLNQDRLSGIRADLTQLPSTTEVRAIVRNTDTDRRRIGVSKVTSQDYVPAVTYYGVAENSQVTLDEAGGGTATSSWTIEGTRAGGKAFVLTRANQFADSYDITDAAGDDLASTLDALINNDFEPLTINRVSLASQMSTTFKQLHISKLEVSVNGGAYRSPKVLIVKPGAKLKLRVSLQPYRSTSTTTTTLSVVVPKNAKGQVGRLSVVGGEDARDSDSPSLECLLLGECSKDTSASLTKLAKSIKNAPRNDSLVAQLDLESEKSSASTSVSSTRRTPLTVTGSRGIRIAVG